MEIGLDAFSSPGFDAKAWVNEQFAALSVDDVVGAGGEPEGGSSGGPEGLAQRLATQLHFLATNAQQNSDRIKARFRHQAAQIARDIAALSRLVQETQQQMAGVAAAVAAQGASAPAVQAIADMGAVRRRVEDSVAALDHLRSYTDLPQKIGALVAGGELARAWALVDSASPAAQQDTSAPGVLSAGEAQNYRRQIQDAVIADLGRAAEADNVDAAARASRLLVEHGCSDAVESEILRLCTERGARRLRRAMPVEGADAHTTLSEVRDILGVVLSLVAADRALVEAVDMPRPDALLEDLLSRHIESVLPCIQRAAAHAQHGDSVDLVLDLYQTLAGFYDGLLNAASMSTLSVGDSSGAVARLMESPIPRSLRLMFGPLSGSIGGLAELEADRIRQGSLRELLAIGADSSRAEPFVRDVSRAIVGVFADIEQALDRVFASVPPSRVGDAVSALAAPALAVHRHLHDALADVARTAGVPLADLTEFTRLGDLPGAAFSGAAYQPLTSEGKLAAVSGCIGLALLGHVFEQCAAETAVSVGRRWAGLLETLAQAGFGPGADNRSPTTAEPAKALLIAFMDARSTAAEMSVAAARLAAGPPPDGAARVEEAAARLTGQLGSAVLFLLTSSFRQPLARIPASDAWHAVHESKSSMDIAVPRFSCSPSEEAVDIGEKMHILLPELEQVEMMHAQYARAVGALATIPPLYAWMLESLAATVHSGESPGSPAPSPMLAMLSLVLQAVQQGFVDQVCRIQPPMTSHGRQQLSADAEYVASVASSFVGSAALELDTLRRLVDGLDADGQADQLLDHAARDKLRALLPPPPAMPR